MSEPEIDWSAVSAERFVRNATPHQEKRWLDAVEDVRHFDEAIMLCISYGQDEKRRRTEDAKALFILKQEGLQAHQRHQESMAVDRSQKRAGWSGVWVAALGVPLGVVLTLLAQKCQEGTTHSQSPSTSRPDNHVGEIPASPPSVQQAGNATAPIQSKPAAPQQAPASPEPKLGNPPTLPK